ncbi:MULTISPECIES: sulfite exporter TauE/SafE family protein [unclassified Helicobacter]|uniref:sulfite exporter TauE/SafE family protein n=1 Tax=unclassified Helicobacter TaxID=2593540 RepID=UPI000CF0E682|nr:MULTISPECIES: sulfite exporter TauE/SafE family protein [unclassified Helicobacter]
MEFLLIIIGFCSGMISGLFGLGGGTLIVPLMLSFGMGIQHSIGISVVQMIFASLFGSILNLKNKTFEIKEGVILGLGGLVGASFSGIVLGFISDFLLTFLFLLVIIYSFLKFLMKKDNPEDKKLETNQHKKIVLFLAGSLTGVFAISLGIGGGLLIVPILGYYLGYNTKKSTALSLFFIIFSSISGSISLFVNHIINLEVIQKGSIIGIASLVGVSVGIYLVQRISLKIHKVFLLIMYTFSMSLTTFHLLERL